MRWVPIPFLGESMSKLVGRCVVTLIATALVAAPVITQTAQAATGNSFATLSSADLSKVVSDPTFAPTGITITSTYVQDGGVREGLLCYTADWKPVTVAPAHLVWRALQSNDLGGGISIYQYPTVQAAAASMKAMISARCPNGANPKTPLTQSKVTLPEKNGGRGVAVTSTMIDDGAFETHDSAFRQVGKAIVEFRVLYPGKANSAIAAAVRPQLPGLADRVAAAYRAAAAR